MIDRMTSADADVLHEARLVLERLAKEARDGLYTAATNMADASDLGRFAEACTTAEDAVFRTLNVAASYLGDETALSAHERWMARNTSEVA